MSRSGIRTAITLAEKVSQENIVQSPFYLLCQSSMYYEVYAIVLSSTPVFKLPSSMESSSFPSLQPCTMYLYHICLVHSLFTGNHYWLDLVLLSRFFKFPLFPLFPRTLQYFPSSSSISPLLPVFPLLLQYFPSSSSISPPPPVFQLWNIRASVVPLVS